MSDEITFYHNPRSRTAIAHWMLEETGAPYRAVILDLEKGEQKAPEFLAVNPMGKIPTIVHRGVVVTEAAAILAYLADAFPEAGLAPAVSDPRRGAYYRWLFFTAGCFEPAVTDRMFGRPPVEQAMALGYGSYDAVIDTIEGALKGGPYLLGDAFTAADVYLASELSWTGMFGAPRIKDNPLFDAYVARCRERPAFERTAG